MTFDNAEELYKIQRFYPKAQLVLRILTDDSKSLCQLGLKFGAPRDRSNPFGFGGCIRARRVFDQAKQHFGFDFKFLAIGGGFPTANAKDEIAFEKVATLLGPQIDELFGPEVRVIAEPGRYYVGSAFTFATTGHLEMDL
ncbi:hypothetical protein BGZ65_000063, partial [Modicella reniformis]